MKFLVDANLSPRIATGLADVGYEATHVADIDLLQASDEAILARALADHSVIITADSDFPLMLATSGADMPSVVLVRVADLPAKDLLALLLANVPNVADDLATGAVASISRTRVRVRHLPIS